MTIPATRDLPPGALERRHAHLLAEVAAAPRGAPPPRTVPALAALLVVAVAALLLVAPWQGTPSLTDRALAAIGDGPVLHVVTERDDWFPPYVDIETGAVRTETIRTEIWFDEGRALKKTVHHLGRVVLDETLETPAGGFTREGSLITCAWIAAHPVEATKLRVSCNENMENGTTLRKIPETPPTVEPTLSGFVDGYRAALDAGTARELRRDEIDGRDVVWLRFPPPAQRPAGAPEFPPTDVAVDAASFRPVRIRSGDPGFDTTVHVAEALRYDERLFTKPELAPPRPSSGRVNEQEAIELRDAAQLLGRAPLWLGEQWNEFRLVEVRRLEPSTGYGELSGREPTRADAVRLTYEAENGRRIMLEEGATCQVAFAQMCRDRIPREGELRVGSFSGLSYARLDGLHVTIRTHSMDVEPLAIARALMRAPDG